MWLVGGGACENLEGSLSDFAGIGRVADVTSFFFAFFAFSALSALSASPAWLYALHNACGLRSNNYSLAVNLSSPLFLGAFPFKFPGETRRSRNTTIHVYSRS